MTHSIQTIGAIGTGTMGPPTALAFAMAGYNVRLYGRNNQSLANAVNGIHTTLISLRAQNLITSDDANAIVQNRIKATSSLEQAASKADLVIESIAEDLELKKGVFAELDQHAPTHAIFATNSSALSPTEIARVLGRNRQEQFLFSMHFFTPAHLLPIVELAPGRHTSTETMDIAFALLRNMGKEPIQLKKEALGFIVNQIQIAMLAAAFDLVETNEADVLTVDQAAEEILGPHIPVHGLFNTVSSITGLEHLLPIAQTIYTAMQNKACEIADEDIATRADIDKAVQGTLGLRLPITGPFKSADMGGLDVFGSIFKTLSVPVPPTLQSSCDQRRLGVKTGQGILPWTDSEVVALRARREAHIVQAVQKRWRAA